MTTTVNVITSDWSVEVTIADQAGDAVTETTEVVPPETSQTFYLTATRSLTFEELPKSEDAA